VACSKAPDDNQITADIQYKINSDSGLTGKQLIIQSDHGSVTLSGEVDNDTQRAAAAKYASSEPGVKLVVNNLHVAPPLPIPVQQQAPAPAPEKPRVAKKRRDHQAKPKDDTAVMAANVVLPAAPPPVPAPAPAPIEQAPPPPPPPPPPAPQRVTIQSGTTITISLEDSLDSETGQVGQTFHASLNTPLSVDGGVVVPSGSEIIGHIVDVKSAGKFAGQSTLSIQLDSIASGGQTYNISTNAYVKTGSSRGKNTAEKVGGGAVLGTLIGALAGGGKGAAIGAAAGAGLGGGAQAASKSQQIKLPSETVINFTLQAPVTVVANSQNPNAARPKLNQ
jgi:hypothetical protein